MIQRAVQPSVPVSSQFEKQLKWCYRNFGIPNSQRAEPDSSCVSLVPSFVFRCYDCQFLSTWCEVACCQRFLPTALYLQLRSPTHGMHFSVFHLLLGQDDTTSTIVFVFYTLNINELFIHWSNSWRLRWTSCRSKGHAWNHYWLSLRIAASYWMQPKVFLQAAKHVVPLVLPDHACHAKRRWMSPSATPATWNEGGCHQVPCVPRKVPRHHRRPIPPPEPAQCPKCHVCHAKRRWMSPSATPATWNKGGCHQVPCVPRKVPRRRRRPIQVQASHQSRPSAQVPRLLRKNEGGCRQVPRLPRHSSFFMLQRSLGLATYV